MTRRTLALLTLALPALLTVAPAHAAPLNDLFDRLPTGARTAIAIDVAALRASKHFNQVIAVLESVDEVRSVRFGPDSGLSPATDLDAIAMVVMLDGRGVAAVRGKKLDAKKARTYLTKRGKGKLDERKVDGGVILQSAGGPSVAFLGDQMALVGPSDLVGKALGVKPGKREPVLRAGSLAYLHKAAPKDAPFWAIGATQVADRERLKKAGRTIVAGVANYSVRGDLGSDLTVTTTATCTSEKACTTLGESIEGKLNELKSAMTLKLLGVAAYLDKVSLAQSADKLTLKVDLDDSSLGVLLAVGPRLYKAFR